MSHVHAHTRERALKDAIVWRLGKVSCSCSPDLATEIVIEPEATKEEVLQALEVLEGEGKVRRVAPARQARPPRSKYHVVFELVGLGRARVPQQPSRPS